MLKNLLLIAVLILTSVFALAACGDDDESGNTSHVHTFYEWETTKKATCTAKGEKVRYCSCGKKQTADIPPTSHTYGEWKTVKEASCTENGKQERTCICGDKQSSTVPMIPHGYSAWIIVEEATLYEAGLKSRSCFGCGNSEEEVIDCLEAVYVDKDEFLSTIYAAKDKITSLRGFSVEYHKGINISTGKPRIYLSESFYQKENTIIYNKHSVNPLSDEWYVKQNGEYLYILDKRSDSSPDADHYYKSITEAAFSSAASRGALIEKLFENMTYIAEADDVSILASLADGSIIYEISTTVNKPLRNEEKKFRIGLKDGIVTLLGTYDGDEYNSVYAIKVIDELKIPDIGDYEEQ